MAKKSKRQVRIQTSADTNARNEFNPDYSDVKKDLKNIGLLAGSFITILIVLSFILK